VRRFERLVSAAGNVPGVFAVLRTARWKRLRPMLAPLFTRSWLALVLVSGCFSEPGSLGEGGGTTSVQSCEAGGLGCVCYGNASCDFGLECVTALDVCVPMDCAAGSLQCVCDDGGCDGVLACTDGVCVESTPGTASATGDPTGDPTGDTQVADESTGPGTSSDPSATASEGSSSSGSAEGTTEGETGEIQCGELACDECPVCAVGPAADCAALSAVCDDEPGCQTAASCLMNCGVTGFCFDDCCASATPMAASAAMALNTCRADECTVACGEYFSGLCSG